MLVYGGGGLEARLGVFGLVPHWAKTPNESIRRCYNARSETVATKPSFRDAWRKGQRCIVPAEAFFEPNWETGKAIRWRIERSDARPVLVGGLWSEWADKSTGEILLSFSLLTVSVETHALLKRLHGPEDEKRGLVMLGAEDSERWLKGDSGEVEALLRPYASDELVGCPDPLVRRGRG